jgi:hypothetical protein
MIDPKNMLCPMFFLLVESTRSSRFHMLLEPHKRRWRRLSLIFPAGMNAGNLEL